MVNNYSNKKKEIPRRKVEHRSSPKRGIGEKVRGKEGFTGKL